MGGRFLLDTNIIIAIFAYDRSVLEALKAANEVFVASIVLGELFYGAYKSAHADTNIFKIEEFASVCPVLNCDIGTSREYGKIKNALRIKGQPIPENDIWIAALAFQHNLTLVSRDQHFKKIDGLRMEAW